MRSGIGEEPGMMDDAITFAPAEEDVTVWSAEDDSAVFLAVARRAFVEDVPLVVYTVEGYEVSWMVTGAEPDGVWGYDQGQAVFALTLRRLERYGDMPPLFLPRERIATMIAMAQDAVAAMF